MTPDDPNGDGLTGPYNVRFQVDNGAVSGSQRVNNLEKTVTFSGTINPDRSTTKLEASMENLGTVHFDSGTLDSSSNPDKITGRYTHRAQNGSVQDTGSYILDKR